MNFELAAQIAAYADRSEITGNEAYEALKVLTQISYGDLNDMAAHNLMNDAAGDHLPAFSDWVTAPEAAEPVAARVQLQEDFAAYSAEVQAARANREIVRPGTHFNGYPFEHEGESLIAKWAKQNPYRATAAVHNQTSALIRTDGLHPALEQPRAVSFEEGFVVSEYFEGKSPMRLSPQEVLRVTPESVEAGLHGAILAGEDKLQLDVNGDNARVDAAGNFGLYDLNVDYEVPTAQLAADAALDFRELVGSLGGSGIYSDFEVLRHRRRLQGHVHDCAKDMLRMYE